MRVIIAGKSNSGKTTLFNALTSSTAHTGNWHGVTTDPNVKTVKFSSLEVEFVDLAGLESFSTYTLEEEGALSKLKKKDCDLIINVIEASSLLESLKLTRSLSTLGVPMILFVNFYNEFLADGGKINSQLIDKNLNATVIYGDAIDKKCVQQIKDIITSGKYGLISPNFTIFESMVETPKFRLTGLDRMLFSPGFAVFSYLAVLVAIFYLAFGRFGLGGLFALFIEPIVDWVKLNFEIILIKLDVNAFLSGLICDGFIGGLGSVLLFIPQLIVLEFGLIALEQSGVIARISFAVDSLLSKVGLNGRAVFCLLMGFGCSALAVSVSNGMENEGIKRRMIRALGFVSCSARTPVFMYFSSLVFVQFSWIVLLCAYIFSVVMTLIYLSVDNRVSKAKVPPMILQVPRLRAVKLKTALKSLKKYVKEFIIKLVTVVLLVSAMIYVLSSVSTNFTYLSDGELSSSILAFFGGKISFLFAPIGLGSWEISTAFLSGIFAKEAIISTLYLIANDTLSLTVAQALSLIVFTLFYTPCIVALDSMRKHVGFWGVVKIALFQFVVALLLCYVTYFLVESMLFRFVFTAIILVVAIAKFIQKRIANEGFCCKNRRKTVKNATERIFRKP